MDPKQAFLDLLDEAIAETGMDLEDRKQEVADYAAERSLHLSTIAAEPGFEQALRAERNSVALRAGLAVDDAASAHDQRVFGMIAGALRIAALALA